MSYYSIINSQTELYCVFGEYGFVCVCTYIHTHPYVHLLRMLLGCVMPWRKCKASYRANHCLHAHRFWAVLLATSVQPGKTAVYRIGPVFEVRRDSSLPIKASVAWFAIADYRVFSTALDAPFATNGPFATCRSFCIGTIASESKGCKSTKFN